MSQQPKRNDGNIDWLLILAIFGLISLLLWVGYPNFK